MSLKIKGVCFVSAILYNINVGQLHRFLYQMIVCMDANFRLKNQLVSNYSQDPGLGIGWAYMLPRSEYESYVLSRAKDNDVSADSISICNHLSYNMLGQYLC